VGQNSSYGGILKRLEMALRYIIIAIVVVLALVIAVIYTIRLKVYVNSDNNDRLILWYSSYIRRKKQRNRGLLAMLDYESQLKYLADNNLIALSNEDMSKVLTILTKAGFSKEEISAEDIKYVKKCL
jgi:hypothetical protein